MPKTVSFLYVKEIDDQEYFEICAEGKVCLSDRPQDRGHLPEKARISVNIDSEVLTKREVLGVLPAVFDVKRGFELEKYQVSSVTSGPFLEFHFDNESLKVRVEKQREVSFQEMAAVVSHTLHSIVNVPEDFFLRKNQ